MPRSADFTQKTKDNLAAKVGYCCSNPFCRRSTIGANADSTGTINIGEAAHITAAEPGGARYDPSLSTKERKDESNGIWLCRNHAAMIDCDEKLFTVDLLRRWKVEAEREANHRLQGIAPSENSLFALRVMLDDLARCSESIEFLASSGRTYVVPADWFPITKDYEDKIEALVDFIGMKYASRIRNSFREISVFRDIVEREGIRFKDGSGRIMHADAAVYSSRLHAFLHRIKKYRIHELLASLNQLFDEEE